MVSAPLSVWMMGEPDATARVRTLAGLLLLSIVHPPVLKISWPTVRVASKWTGVELTRLKVATAPAASGAGPGFQLAALPQRKPLSTPVHVPSAAKDNWQ